MLSIWVMFRLALPTRLQSVHLSGNVDTLSIYRQQRVNIYKGESVSKRKDLHSPLQCLCLLAMFQTDSITAPVAVTIGITPPWPAGDCHLAGTLPASQQPPHRPSLSSTKSVPLAPRTGWGTGLNKSGKPVNMGAVSMKLTEKVSNHEGLVSIQGT